MAFPLYGTAEARDRSPLPPERREVVARRRPQPGLEPLQDVDRAPEIVALLRVEAVFPFADEIGLDRGKRVTHVRIVEERLHHHRASGTFFRSHGVLLSSL